MSEFEYYELSNGLKVVLHQTHEEVIFAKLVIKSGTMFVEKNTYNLNHLVEHFLMTKNYNNGKNFYQEIESFGAWLYAEVNNLFTEYRISGLQGDEKRIIKAFTDYVFNANFSGYDLNRLIADVMNEYYEEKTVGVVTSDIKYLLSGSKEFTLSQGEILKQLANTSSEQIQDFYNKYYSPANSALVVIGGINKKKINSFIRSSLRGITKGDDYFFPKTIIQDLEHLSIVEKENERDVNSLDMIFRCSVEDNTRAHMVLRILKVLMTFHHKLFLGQILRYRLRLGYWTFTDLFTYSDNTYLRFHANLKEIKTETVHFLLEALKLIKKGETVGEDLFLMAKKITVLKQHIVSRDLNDQSDLLIRALMYGRKLLSTEEKADMIKNISRDEFLETINKLIKSENMYIVIKGKLADDKQLNLKLVD